MITAIPNAHRRWSARIVVAYLFLLGVDVAAVEFVPLGFLDDRFRQSWANGISGDGRVVVGESGHRAFRWTADKGMIRLGDVGLESRANAASFDGSIVVGEDESQNGGFRWTEEEGMVALPNRGAAVDISADGTVIVGYDGKALLWKQHEGLIRLPDPDDCCWDSVRPSAISADGSVVVGTAYITSTPSPYRWIEGVGADGFLRVNTNAFPSDTSGDGSMIVGILDHSNDSSDAFRWTDSGGLAVMPPPVEYGVPPLSSALAVSADGSVIAGYIGQYHTSDYWENLDAAVWDEVRGWRRIDGILARGGVDLAGWHLSTVDDISANGRVVVGRGIDPDGNTEAWMAVIPEPATLLMIVPLVAFASCVIRKGRRTRR